MADGLNCVHLLGHVGSSPSLRYTQEGQCVLNFDIATESSYVKNNEVHKRTDWHHVAIWGKRAEGLSPHVVKGSKIYIGGSLRTSSWESNGQKHYKTEVAADEVILCGSPKGAREPQENKGDAAPSGESYPF